VKLSTSGKLCVLKVYISLLNLCSLSVARNTT